MNIQKHLFSFIVQIVCTPGKKKEVIDFLRNLEYKVYGSEDFEYTFLEDDIKAMYTQDRQTATIYSIFAGCISYLIKITTEPCSDRIDSRLDSRCQMSFKIILYYCNDRLKRSVSISPFLIFFNHSSAID